MRYRNNGWNKKRKMFLDGGSVRKMVTFLPPASFFLHQLVHHPIITTSLLAVLLSHHQCIQSWHRESFPYFHFHTSYLSFLLHWQDFWKPNFTFQKTTKGTKNTKNVSEKVKYMHFFHSIWKTIRKFLHRHVCGVCDKYEVWYPVTIQAKYM